MINIVRKILRSKKNTIHNPKLIKKLHKDHQTLLKLFIKLENKPSINNFNRFMKELELHLLLEDTNLYATLESRYSLCKSDAIIQEVKNKITEAIPQLEKLQNLIENNGSKEEINHLLNAIKDYLLHRINLEEKVLFNIYDHYVHCGRIEQELKVFMQDTN